MTAEPEVLFEQRGCAGIITLNRPRALNALTLNMVREITPQLAAWAGDGSIAHVIIQATGDRAFCAGGDIRQLYEWGLTKDRTFLDFYRAEYLLNTAIKRFPKPYIALMDGITMGGGVGVSVHGSHRIATERLTFAMPETGIGLFPDVGGSYFLPRCPGATGMYLGLTGYRLKAADAWALGIATDYIEAKRLEDLISELTVSSDVDGCIAAFKGDPGPAPIEDVRYMIDRHFAQTDVTRIVAELETADDKWAEQTARILKTKSPTSLEITVRQIARGRDLEFEDCMTMEYRIVNRIFSGHDFFEGTRAVVIDKDQAPKWKPARLAEIDPADIERYFEPIDEELPV